MIGIGGYIVGGMSLALLAAGAWGYIERQGRQNAELQVSIEKAANEQNKITIDNMNDWRDANQAVTLELAKQLEAERKSEDDERSEIDKLTNSDEAVRQWRSTPLPPGLRSLLNRKKRVE